MITFETVPLDDPIWSKLSSAYGIEDIAGPLKQLQTGWNSAIAQDLFWEKLHHQETLYPATYAAMPWLWNTAVKFPEAQLEFAEFLSWCIYCALGDREDDEFRWGMTLDAEAQGHPWFSENSPLSSHDQDRLRSILETARSIFCEQEGFLLDTAMKNPGNVEAVLVGVPTLRGSSTVGGLLDGNDGQYHIACPDCGAMQVVKWNGVEFVVIVEDDGEFETVALTGRERTVAKELALEVQGFQPALADLLKGYAGWSCCRPGDLPSYDPENASRDLFD